MPKLASPHVVNIADLRALARKRLPNAAFDYLDGAAEGEVTARDNIAAFADVVFKPRQAVMTNPDLSTRVLGVDLSVPFILSPIGYSRMLHPRGELAGAGGAKRIGTGYILSTISGHPLEKVREQNDKVFFQVYLMGGREAKLDLDEVTRLGDLTQAVTSLDQPLGDDSEASLGDMFVSDRQGPVEELVDAEQVDAVSSALDELPQLEREVIELRFGLADSDEQSANAIAKQLGLSGDRVEDLERSALRRLRRGGRLDAHREAA